MNFDQRIPGLFLRSLRFGRNESEPATMRLGCYESLVQLIFLLPMALTFYDVNSVSYTEFMRSCGLPEKVFTGETIEDITT